jgi:DNA-binding response OmpR family regulator
VALVLLVEDDFAIAEPLTRALRGQRHDVETVAEAEEAAARAMAGAHDLVILDLGLPGPDGLEVCRRIRSARPAVPILILTARAEESDAVAGLDAGADDFQTKPFRLAELMARVRALLRRSAPGVEAAGGVRVDPAARRAWVGDAELSLSPKEFELLALLVAEAGQVVRRERIMAEVWDANWYGSTKTLDVHVSSLRRKLGDNLERPRLLITVRGVGLRLEAAD